MGFKLLIVDDEQIILKSYSRLLGLQLPDISILSAKNGIEGLGLIRSEQPNLILLDLAMPEMNGFEVLAQMQKDKIIIPTIVMTAFDTQDNIELARIISQNDYIQVLRKPVEIPVLLKKISEVMG